MQQIKFLLESLGLPVKENRYLGVMPLPCIIYTDDIETGGADLLNNVITHNIGVELYAEKIDRMNEERIENLLDEMPVRYTRTRNWVESEKFFLTLYTFDFIERK